ncbi:MAG: 4-hydroxy-tetrahydrodipicolinate synthase [Candidatus Latescibacterota bacterium]|nr:MAG: 4-hydroxy-tetrahydrodipicolinate synthase [Candidatus Latescibacterota bacterium]
MLQGVLTAVVSPFRDGAVDGKAFVALLREQVAAGVRGVVVCGSTGEAATLTPDERERLVALALETCAGSATQVWVGTGTNCTRTTIELTRQAERQGVAGAMIVAPPYNKPTQEGLFRHFSEVANATELPLILYNVPGRTSVHVAPETVARVHDLERYVALKEASGSLDQVTDVRARCGMTVLSGDDSLTLPMLAVGARGVISVVSNLLPRETIKLVEAALAGDFDTARTWHFRLWPFFKGAFIETNPAPIKMLLALDGKTTPETRLPLVPATDDARSRLAALLQSAEWRGVRT